MLCNLIKKHVFFEKNIFFVFDKVKDFQKSLIKPAAAVAVAAAAFPLIQNVRVYATPFTNKQTDR